MTSDALQIGWTTFSDESVAKKVAATLIEERLAACVQVDSPCTAFYHWEGKIQTDTEVRVWVKFPAGRAGELWSRLEDLHPYETPQWVVVTATDVSAGYAEWVAKTVS